MKCAAVNWSSPLHRGVQLASPNPTIPASVCTFTNRNGESECDPPRPDLMAKFARIGTRTGMVSMAVIFIADSCCTAEAQRAQRKTEWKIDDGGWKQSLCHSSILHPSFSLFLRDLS